jgi:hypothetical protein
MNERDDDPDFVASARRLAVEMLPMLRGLAEAAYNPDWAEAGTTRATYLTLLSAALHQLATAEMAKEAKLDPGIEAMFTGIKIYGMMWSCMIDIARGEDVVFQGSVH